MKKEDENIDLLDDKDRDEYYEDGNVKLTRDGYFFVWDGVDKKWCWDFWGGIVECAGNWKEISAEEAYQKQLELYKKK